MDTASLFITVWHGIYANIDDDDYLKQRGQDTKKQLFIVFRCALDVRRAGASRFFDSLFFKALFLRRKKIFELITRTHIPSFSYSCLIPIFSTNLDHITTTSSSNRMKIIKNVYFCCCCCFVGPLFNVCL